MASLPSVRLKHAGIFVTDFPTMFDFYTKLFGFQVSDRADSAERNVAFLTNDPTAHHALVIASGRPVGSPSTVQQLSFYAETLDDVRRYWRAVKADSRVTRMYTTTHGNAWSLYFWDPEDNRIEIYTDTPWHIPQPAGLDIDLDQSDDEIYRQTEAYVRADPAFEPIGDWQSKTAHNLGIDGFKPKTS